MAKAVSSADWSIEHNSEILLVYSEKKFKWHWLSIQLATKTKPYFTSLAQVLWFDRDNATIGSKRNHQNTRTMRRSIL